MKGKGLRAFFTGWGSNFCLNFGGKIIQYNYLQKGKKNSILVENGMSLKNFSLGKPPLNSPCYRRGKNLT
jgi:hypothetical protein